MAITAIHPYLSFNGNCEEAFAHYAKVLGARSTGLFRYGDAPAEPDENSDSSPPDCEPLPADWKDKVMNTELRVGDLVLMGSDSPPQYQAKTEGMTVSIQPLITGHILGQILEAFGEDHVVWGTDSIWWGTPQWQIEALRRFQIPKELQDKFGYKPLTNQIKDKIFGLNAAKVYGVDVAAKRKAIPADYLSKLKTAYRWHGAEPSLAAYGWVPREG